MKDESKSVDKPEKNMDKWATTVGQLVVLYELDSEMGGYRHRG